MRIIDCTYTMMDQMPVYPGDEGVEIKQVRFLEHHYYNSYSMKSSTHAGTHIDGPMHMTESKKRMDEVELTELIGRGRLIEVHGERAMLDEQYELIQEGDIILFRTGAEKKYGTKAYYTEHPQLSEEVVDYLIAKKVRVIGIDAPSIEWGTYTLHPKWFRYGGYIVENIKNMDELRNLMDFEVNIIPLKVQADSSPARVFVRV